MALDGNNREMTRKFAWLPGAAAVAAFVACNCTFLLVGLLSLFGVTLVINPHVQAAAISIFALLTLIFVFFGYRSYRRAGPLILSILGAVLVVGTLYIAFNKIVETTGLALLIAASIWSWQKSVQHRAG